MLLIHIIFSVVLCSNASQLRSINNKWKLMYSYNFNHRDQKLMKVYLIGVLEQQILTIFDTKFIYFATISLRSTHHNHIVFSEEAFDKFHTVLRMYGCEIPRALLMVTNQMYGIERCAYIDVENDRKGILKNPKSKTKDSLQSPKLKKVRFGSSSYRVIPNREMLKRERLRHEEEEMRRNLVIRQNPVQFIPRSRIQYIPQGRIQYISQSGIQHNLQSRAQYTFPSIAHYNPSSRIQCIPRRNVQYNPQSRNQYNPPMFYRPQQPTRQTRSSRPPLLSQVLYS